MPSKIVMKTFDEYVIQLKTPSDFQKALDRIITVHEAIQQCEAGAKPDRETRAKAFFLFLCLAGFYPDVVLGRCVTARRLVRWDSVMVTLEDGANRFCSLLRGHGLPGQTEPHQYLIEAVIYAAFPKANIFHSAERSADLSVVHHVSIRDEYFPKKAQISTSGSAVCSDRKIAYMQAFVRLCYAVTLDAAGSAFIATGEAKKDDIYTRIADEFRKNEKKHDPLVDDYTNRSVYPKPKTDVQVKITTPDADSFRQSQEQIRDFMLGKMLAAGASKPRPELAFYRTFDRKGGDLTIAACSALAAKTAMFYRLNWTGPIWTKCGVKPKKLDRPNLSMAEYRSTDGLYSVFTRWGVFRARYHMNMRHNYLGDLWTKCG